MRRACCAIDAFGSLITKATRCFFIERLPGDVAIAGIGRPGGSRGVARGIDLLRRMGCFAWSATMEVAVTVV